MNWSTSIRRSVGIGPTHRPAAGLFSILLLLSMIQSVWFVMRFSMESSMTMRQSSVPSDFYFVSLDDASKRSVMQYEDEKQWVNIDQKRLPDKNFNDFLPNLTSMLQQTLCPSHSPVLDLLSRETNHISSGRLQELRQWTARLIYAVLFEHQHQPALKEALNHTRHYNTTLWDNPPTCHCPTAKFLVVALSKNGLGANIRLGAIPALQIGMASNRVVLFINDVSAGPKFLQEPWPLTSCRTNENDSFRFDFPRNDYNCFFRPISPCTLTDDELSDAHVLRRSELRQLFRSGDLPDDRKNDRVLIAHFPFRPQRQPENLASRLHERALEWIHRYAEQPKDAQVVSLEFLHQAADFILHSEQINVNINLTTKALFSYYGANSVIYQSFLLYALRPNLWARERLSTIRHQIFAQHPKFSAEDSVGLPIRGTVSVYLFNNRNPNTLHLISLLPLPGSDKCGTESECLSFRQYMNAAKETWIDAPDSAASLFSNVVITTESKQVLIEQTLYASEISLAVDNNSTFPVHFITNTFDVVQDTGYFDASISKSQHSANQIMLSSISSLQLQLQTRLTLGNCCSNFHLLLKDLISVGCGNHPFNAFQCLQDHTNPTFRICCSWDKSVECLARRQIAIERTKSG